MRSQVSYINREAATRSGERIQFSFGENWLAYVAGLQECHVREAEQAFVRSTSLDNLTGYTFLDAGCGSGLSSLVACRLQAERVTSFDVDPHSVACTQQLRARFAGEPPRWTVRRLSLLEPHLCEIVGKARMVCCWGVAHHTGSMWEAIDNVARCVEDEGWFLLAIYNRTRHSGTWLTIKRLYNRAPSVVKALLRAVFHAKVFAGLLVRGQHPGRFLRDYVRHRGMSYWRDVEDWLGGLPYEYASVEEVGAFMTARGFELVRVKHAASHGCNEFVLRKRESPNRT